MLQTKALLKGCNDLEGFQYHTKMECVATLGFARMQPECNRNASSSLLRLVPPPSLSVNNYCSPHIVVLVGCNCVNKSVPTHYFILKS